MLLHVGICIEPGVLVHVPTHLLSNLSQGCIHIVTTMLQPCDNLCN